MLTWTGVHIWGYVLLETIGLFLPSMREDMGLSPVQEGWLSASAMIGNLALALPAGWLMSRLNPKSLSTVTFYAAGFLALIQGWAPMFGVLLAGRFLFGAIMVIREPAGTMLTMQWVAQREIVIINSLRNALWGVVAIGFIAVPVAMKVLDDDWRATFYAFGVTALVLAAVWHVQGRERHTEEYERELRSQEVSPIASIFRYPELWLLGVGMLGIAITWTAFTTFWPSYMLDEYDLSLTASAGIISITGAVASVGGIGVGVLASRVGKKRTVLWMSGIVAAVSCILMLHVSSYGYLIGLGILNGMAWTLFPIVITIPFELKDIKPREIAVTTGFVTTTMWIGGAMGPMMAGFIQGGTDDLRLALTVTSLCALVMTATGLLMPRRYDEPSG